MRARRLLGLDREGDGQALDGLGILAPRQRKNGSFGGPCAVERVAAVLAGLRAIGSAKN